MRTRPTILFFSPDGCPVPALVRQWAAANAFPLLVFSQRRRGRVDRTPRAIPASCSLTATGGHDGLALVRRLKSDAFTAIVPVTDAGGRPTTPSRSRRGSRRAPTRSSPASSPRRSSAPGSTPCWCAPSGTSRCIPRPGCRARPRSSGRSAGGSNRARSSRSATPTSITSRSSTTATATTTATGSSTCCPASCTTW